MALREAARIKGFDEYSWFIYTGPTLNLNFRDTPHTLRKGDLFGVRYSSNKQEKRLVVGKSGLGINKVITIRDPALERHLSKNHKQIDQRKAESLYEDQMLIPSYKDNK